MTQTDHADAADAPLPTVVSRAPHYDRGELRPSIVHIGVGGFHRAHLAVYVHELCVSGHTDWGIVGAGILPGDEAMSVALSAQDHLYSVIVRGAASTSVEVVGSIVDYVFAANDFGALADRIAATETQIVSLTITEGGYPIDDETGAFLATEATAGPRSAFAALVEGLERRRVEGGGPLTVLSCDNILANGRAARTSTLGLALARSGALVDWIEENVTFPNSMVDRITPATVDADRRWLVEHEGITDRWPVVTEPFRQWVVEDRFAGDRLPLEALDVIVTDDVEPYELMKLRLLNAGHSCLAYLAALEGIETVDQAMAAPHISAFVSAFLRAEAKPVVGRVPGVDLDDYIDSLIERFSNPGIGDQVARLCLDGSVKFPKFLMPTIETRLADSQPVDASALALAGWCQYLLGADEAGRSIELAADPGLAAAVSFAEASRDDPLAFLENDAVFSAAVRSDARFRSAFADAVRSLRAGGVRSAIADVTSIAND